MAIEGDKPIRLPQLEDLPAVKGRRVLVRCDFNVPMSGGVIADDLRIRLPVETLTWLLDEGAESETATRRRLAVTAPSTMIAPPMPSTRRIRN